MIDSILTLVGAYMIWSWIRSFIISSNMKVGPLVKNMFDL